MTVDVRRPTGWQSARPSVRPATVRLIPARPHPRSSIGRSPVIGGQMNGRSPPAGRVIHAGVAPRAVDDQFVDRAPVIQDAERPVSGNIDPPRASTLSLPLSRPPALPPVIPPVRPPTHPQYFASDLMLKLEDTLTEKIFLKVPVVDVRSRRPDAVPEGVKQRGVPCRRRRRSPHRTVYCARRRRSTPSGQA